MGRRALQRSPKPVPSSLPNTPTPSESSLPPLQPETSPIPVDDPKLPAPQSPCGRGLDRVLLERNLERLLTEKGGGQSHNPDLERLLLARDRSREPLHLADLSLDDWQPRSAASDNGDQDQGTSCYLLLIYN